MTNILKLFVFMTFMAGCSTHKQMDHTLAPLLPQANNQFAQENQHIQIPSISSLTSLTPEQHTELEAFISKDEIKDLPLRLKVSEFIKHKITNFDYEGKNYTSSQAWQAQSGNCMALAMLTYGVAEALGAHAVFQVVYAAPMLTNVTSDLVINSDHVRTFIYDEKPNSHFMSGLQSLMIDYFPDRDDRTGAIITDNEFLAMFYRNLAADALVENKLNVAFILLNKGLSLAPKYDPLINMMGIVHRRIGDEQTAEQYYLYGLALKGNSSSLLNNYRFLLASQGKVEQVAIMDEKLLSLETDNPYALYSMGIEALEFNNYDHAVRYLKRFLRDAPYFHRAYADLAKAQFALGDEEQAKASLTKALALTSRSDSQQKYLAKLSWLNHQAD
jgi:tetratricopeptide (TPR) repeat protein